MLAAAQKLLLCLAARESISPVGLHLLPFPGMFRANLPALFWPPGWSWWPFQSFRRTGLVHWPPVWAHLNVFQVHNDWGVSVAFLRDEGQGSGVSQLLDVLYKPHEHLAVEGLATREWLTLLAVLILNWFWNFGTPSMRVPAKLLQSCPTLCKPMDCSPPVSSVHGILQAGTLEWVAVPSSRGSSRPRGPTCISSLCCIGRRALYHQRHLGSRFSFYTGNYSEFPLFALLVHFTHLISSSAISWVSALYWVLWEEQKEMKHWKGENSPHLR